MSTKRDIREVSAITAERRRKERTMIIHSQRVFDKVLIDQDDPSVFIKYVSYDVKRELVNKLMDHIEDHKSHVVVLKEPEFIKDLSEMWRSQCAYKQDLLCLTVVQCKNCRMAYPWCQRFRKELGGEGYCPYGNPVEVMK